MQFSRLNIRDTKKMLRNNIVRLEKISEFASGYFFTGVISFLSFIKNVLIKIKNSNFPPKYTRHGKNVKKQHCSSRKYQRICF